MATAIIPLVTALAPEIISLITSLVHKKAPAAEAALGAGTGPVKLAQVLQDVTSALQSAVNAGTLPGPMPLASEIQNIVQAVVSSLQSQGYLQSTPLGAAPSLPAPLPSVTTTWPSSQATVASGYKYYPFTAIGTATGV